MKPKKLLTTLALVSVVLIAGCKKDTFVETTGVCPIVISTDPANLATGVPLNKVITATFNVKMNPATITQASFTIKGASAITGTVSYTGTTASFVPSSPLTPNTTYTGTITKSAKDLMRQSPKYDYVWTFTTVSPYTVTVSSNPLAGGTTSGSGSFNSGSSVTVTAAANAGYTFTNWTESGTAVSTTAGYTFTISGNRTLVANYTAPYTVALSSNPAAGGTTSGSGTFNSGASVTVTAVANTGYTFTNWTESGIVVSTTAGYTFTISVNRILVANFTINNYTLNVTANNGTVVKNPNQTTYNYGTTVTLTPTPDTGYTFTSWSGDAAGTISPTSVLMNANKNITANFTLISAVCPTIVDLGTSGNYVILTKAGISTTGVTSITGNMGVSPITSTAITGFGLILSADGTFSTSSLVTGNIYAPDYASPTPANLTTAVGNMETAYTYANGLVVPAPVTELLAGNLNGQTLTKGIYKWGTGVSITNGITLDGGGDACATWIFQIAEDLTVANGAIITLTNGADAKNIFWVVAGSKADLGTTVDFKGNILCKTLISLKSGAKVTGRLLAQTEVTLIGSTVVLPSKK